MTVELSSGEIIGTITDSSGAAGPAARRREAERDGPRAVLRRVSSSVVDRERRVLRIDPPSGLID